MKTSSKEKKVCVLSTKQRGMNALGCKSNNNKVAAVKW